MHMLSAICIALIFLFIMSFSIISEVRLNIDIYGKKNSIVFCLFGIKVIDIDIAFEGSDFDSFRLLLKNKDKVITTLNLNQVDRNSAKNAIKQALPNPFYNLDIIEIVAYAEYGGDDAFRTVIIVSILQWLFGGALLYILSTQRLKAMSEVKANFQNKSLILRVSGIFSITIADIIYGIIFSKKEKSNNDIGK